MQMLLDYDRIDSELVGALEQMPPLDITRDNIAEIRALLASRPKPPTSVDVLQESTVISTNEHGVPVIIYRKTRRANQPALLWIHGGGYILGNADDERARVIAHELDCTVVSVDYRLAPEHPFPAGPDDCITTLNWMKENSIELKIDPSRLAVGGASAGAGMAAGVALMNRDKSGLNLVLQLLLYPMIDNLHATDSGQIENHPIWNQGTSFNAWEMYLDGTPNVDASPYAAASRAEDLSGLPPTYLCVGSEDLFRDENIEYARRLFAQGVPCEMTVFPGLYHGGDMFVPGAGVSQRLQKGFLAALGDAFKDKE
jgi:acetyl esterase/lipase